MVEFGLKSNWVFTSHANSRHVFYTLAYTKFTFIMVLTPLWVKVKGGKKILCTWNWCGNWAGGVGGITSAAGLRGCPTFGEDGCLGWMFNKSGYWSGSEKKLRSRIYWLSWIFLFFYIDKNLPVKPVWKFSPVILLEVTIKVLGCCILGERNTGRFSILSQFGRSGAGGIPTEKNIKLFFNWLHC